MDHRDFLKTASEILAERGKSYGGVEQSFDRASQVATLLGTQITPAGVATVMLAVKLARIAENPAHFDSHVDAINYLAFRGEFIGAEPIEPTKTQNWPTADSF